MDAEVKGSHVLLWFLWDRRGMSVIVDAVLCTGLWFAAEPGMCYRKLLLHGTGRRYYGVPGLLGSSEGCSVLEFLHCSCQQVGGYACACMRELRGWIFCQWTGR